MHPTSTILIVDDEAVGRDTLEALLFAEGYELVFASDGPEALSVAAQHLPDLILLDVMMPGMDGFQVCQRLRADPALGEIPVVMVTALDDRDSRLRGIACGADDFVTKPFDRVELRTRVKTITRLNRYRHLLVERAKFEKVVEQSSDGYVMLDDNDQIMYVNPQARLYLGLASPGLTNEDQQNRELHPKFHELVRKQYRCEPQGAWVNWPKWLDTHLGTPRYLVRPESETARPFWLQVEMLDIPSESAAGHVVRLRNITLEMDQQRDMRGFHKTVVHKMRTPLVGILSSLELLTRLADRLSGQEISQFSGAAYKSAKRLQDVVEDVLGYMSATRMAKSDDGFVLSQLKAKVNEVSSTLGIRPVSVFCPDVLDGSHLALSERGIELALYEILENARKFHPVQDPTVYVSASEQAPKRVQLRIQDDGIHMSPEHMKQIWSPYYQGEKDFTGEAAGMGLGLATVAALVWEVGGACRAHNRPDQPGVIIELDIPVTSRTAETST